MSPPVAAKVCPASRKQSAIRLLKRGDLTKSRAELTACLEDFPRDAELHYLAGMLAAAEKRFVEAEAAFQQALRLHPRYGAAHFELGIVHATLCRFNRAMDHFRKAKSLRYKPAETSRYLAEVERVAWPRDATLSVCLIVRNEARFLANCLRSVQAVADEIVVVDTGSTDATVEIARTFGAQVYHYRWHNDFAAARNYALEQATGDWILQLDADEELLPEDQPKVREVVHQNRCDGAFLALHCRNSSTFGENQPTVHYLVRLFKNRPDFRYVNPVHEVLQYRGEVIPVDINLLHHGYNLDPEQLKQKRRRNAEILYARLGQNPDDVVTLFYLSMLHLSNREFDECQAFARRVLARSNPNHLHEQHLHLMALNNLALVLVEKGRYAEAERYCRRALAINANYIDPLYFLALSYYRRNKFEQAQQAFHEFLERFDRLAQVPVFNLFISSASAYRFQAYHLLGKIYRRQGEAQSARRMFEQALELHPTFWPGHADLGYLYMDLEDWEQAAQHLDRAIQLAKENPNVTPKNQALWFDFSNLVKLYAVVLQKRLQQLSCAS